MDMRIDDIGESESELTEESHITLDLVSYGIDDDRFMSLSVSEDVCVGPSLLIEELAEDYSVHRGKIMLFRGA